MTNKEISGQFTLLSKLLDLHGENSFKVKSYSIAAYKIDQLTVGLQSLSKEKIFQLSGIGDAIGSKIQELLETGHMKILDETLVKTPEGILEMMEIKGLGPKKIGIIWKEMQIESVGELLYACQENRLLLLKGFGKKTQDNVMESIEFLLKQKGNFLYAELEPLALQLCDLFSKQFPNAKVALTGALVRHPETVDRIELVLSVPSADIQRAMHGWEDFEPVDSPHETLRYHYLKQIPVILHPTTSDQLVGLGFRLSGGEAFYQHFTESFPAIRYSGLTTEQEIFHEAGISYIPAFLREGKEILETAAKNQIPRLIREEDIRGIIHCHSDWSDGTHSVEALCKACLDRGFEYLVLSDHSKSAFYAHGLSEEKISTQHEMIEKLNQQLAPFKIFKSIESDILNDGSLDYPNSVLSTFDLVIASIHSNLKMTEEKAQARLIGAIENPYTTILGHMTGRLLLSRKGYPVDHKKIIDACAANGVVIEINAHPRRLDMSWKYLDYALQKGVMLSIDPDAHSIEDFAKTRYGVLVAQKGMVGPAQNLSSFSLTELENYLASHRKY